MASIPEPRQILAELLPPLRLAAGYARHVQAQISAQPMKDGPNPFAMALTDADLSIQTFVEVALLGRFPQIRFYGEEFEQSYNTKYFRAITLGPAGDYLVTLDPIDGTLLYMDGFPNYQIIVTVLNADQFEAVLAISPAQNCYYYALREQGAWVCSLEQGLEAGQPLQIGSSNTILLGTKMGFLRQQLSHRYPVVSFADDYSQDHAIPTVNGILTGEVGGVILAVGKFIDGAALAFLAQEAGYMITDYYGQALPRLDQCEDYQWPGLVIASSATIHHDLIQALDDVGSDHWPA